VDLDSQYNRLVEEGEEGLIEEMEELLDEEDEAEEGLAEEMEELLYEEERQQKI
jgi:hypothetical protein